MLNKYFFYHNDKERSLNVFISEQGVKRYPHGVLLDNRKVLSAPRPRAKQFERFLIFQ